MSELRRSVGLKRTPFKPKQVTHGLARSKSRPKPRKLKSKGPKMTPIRKSAKGQECTLRFPCCNFDPETTVWAHSNRTQDGKGMGIKSRDEEGCYACSSCHSWLDGGYAGHMPRSLVDTYFDLARSESQRILKKKGLME